MARVRTAPTDPLQRRRARWSGRRWKRRLARKGWRGWRSTLYAAHRSTPSTGSLAPIPYLGTPTHRLSDHYSHDTAVGPLWGQGGARFSTASNWRIYENTRQMTEAGADPAAVVIEHGHRAGLDVFLSMRVNDVHDLRLQDGLDDPLMSPMKRTHPDWLLGSDAPKRAQDRAFGADEDRVRTAYNFAVPEVRDYKLALAREAIANYDLDGLDWDFLPLSEALP